MALMGAVLSDICSNARLKVYPATEVLQVSNAPIFRAPGWEPQKRSYDVPAKGKGKDPERALEVSRARARAAVRDIALCNQFDYFITWTLDGSLINRYDADEVKRRVLTFLKNKVHRNGFAYVIVPEFHKDGAIHFHGLCKLGTMRLERAVNARTGQPMSTEKGQPIFNMPDWTLGYSTCIPIDGNYERTCNYMVKYFTKDSRKIFGKWYLSSRNLVRRPEMMLVSGGMDFHAFVAEHPGCYIIPLYNDVCLTSVSLTGGDSR